MKVIQIIMDWLGNIDWAGFSQIIGAFATAALAVFAWKGLTTWKHQAHTEVKIRFLDDLIDTVNDYVIAMNIPVTMISFAEIGIKFHSDAEASRGHNGGNDGFIKYIESKGEKSGEKILKQLDIIKPIKSKLLSLITKGQVLGFENFNEIYNAGKMLIWSFDKIESFAVITSSPEWNWGNPTVQNTLSKYRDIKKSEFDKNLAEYSLKILDFAKKENQKLFT